MLTWLKVAIYAGVFIAGALVNGWRIEGNIKDEKIAQANAAISSLTDAAQKVHDAARRYSVNEANFDAALDTIRRDFKNANKPPLPVDCKPDPLRVQQLHNAIDATNAALGYETVRASKKDTLPGK